MSSRTLQEEFPLHWLIWHNEFGELERELATKKHDVEKLDPRGRSPLMLAVTLGHLESSRVLLRHNANVNVENTGGWTAVQEAVATGDPELLQEIVEKRDYQRYSSRVVGIPELLQRLQDISKGGVGRTTRGELADICLRALPFFLEPESRAERLVRLERYGVVPPEVKQVPGDGYRRPEQLAAADQRRCLELLAAEDQRRCTEQLAAENQRRYPEQLAAEDQRRYPEQLAAEDQRRCPELLVTEDQRRCPELLVTEDQRRCPEQLATEDQQPCRRRRHRAPRPALFPDLEHRSRATAKFRCFNCGKNGHRAADCPEPESRRNACYNCAEVGHVQRDCPWKRECEDARDLGARPKDDGGLGRDRI